MRDRQSPGDRRCRAKLAPNAAGDHMTMTSPPVADLMTALLESHLPVAIKAYDGSRTGPADATARVRIRTPQACTGSQPPPASSASPGPSWPATSSSTATSRKIRPAGAPEPRRTAGGRSQRHALATGLGCHPPGDHRRGGPGLAGPDGVMASRGRLVGVAVGGRDRRTKYPPIPTSGRPDRVRSQERW